MQTLTFRCLQKVDPPVKLDVTKIVGSARAPNSRKLVATDGERITITAERLVVICSICDHATDVFMFRDGQARCLDCD